MSKQPIAISRQHSKQNPTISIERNPSQQSSFSQLGPRTSSTDSESAPDIEPLIKQSETQQQTFERHLQSEMSQPANTTSTNPQAPLLTSINPAGIEPLDHHQRTLAICSITSSENLQRIHLISRQQPQ